MNPTESCQRTTITISSVVHHLHESRIWCWFVDQVLEVIVQFESQHLLVQSEKGHEDGTYALGHFHIAPNQTSIKQSNPVQENEH